MPPTNIPCNQKNCDGKLCVIDTVGVGSDTQIRLRCSKCAHISYVKKFLEQFYREIAQNEKTKKPAKKRK